MTDPISAVPQDNLTGIFRYHSLFISDIHLGSGTTAAPYLYEFLSHLDYTALQKLYLVGDIIDGWEHQGGRQKSFPEMERRILDVELCPKVVYEIC